MPNFTDSERFETPKTDCMLKFYKDKEFYVYFNYISYLYNPICLSSLFSGYTLYYMLFVYPVHFFCIKYYREKKNSISFDSRFVDLKNTEERAT